MRRASAATVSRAPEWVWRAAGAVAVLACAACGGGRASGSATAEPAPSTSSAGLVTVASANGMDSTVARLTRALEANSVRVVAQIDHAGAAGRSGLQLRPTVLIIAGNPAAGTPLMQSEQKAAIDLPLKFLVWQDASGRVHLTYNDPAYVAQRHGIRDRAELLGRMANVSKLVAQTATSP